MVNRRGQSMVEFILMLSLLTAIGAFLATSLMGGDKVSGSIGAMQQNTVNKIAHDKD